MHSMALEDTATKVVTVFVVIAVGIVVLNAFWGAIGASSGYIEVNVTDDTGSAVANENITLYDASDDTALYTYETDSNGVVSYSNIQHGEYYLEDSSGTTSSNFTHEYSETYLTYDNVGNTITITNTNSDAFSGVYDTIESMINSVYGLIVILPLILVATVAYKMLSNEM